MLTEARPPVGTVLEIQRMSTEDGPGLRTTVFMKGCPMQCRWCHNPESISPLPQTQWIGSRCLGCRSCLGACPAGALTAPPHGLALDRSRCRGCGTCVEACPSGALELLGKSWAAADLAYELLKDREYFKQSGGGVTLSGGEATLHWPFVAALLTQLQQAGVHTAIDTCGLARREAWEAILPHTDLVLYDLKEMEPQRHQAYTHSALERVLESFGFVVDYIRTHARPKEIWVRTPLIPGATARAENVAQIGAFITRHAAGTVSRWELLAFNNLCQDKYQRLGQVWSFENTDLLTRETMEHLAEVARQSSVDPALVRWSGTTRREGEPEA